MSTKSGRWALWPVAAAVACLAGALPPASAWAQAEPVPLIASERDEAADPPARAGRLAEVQGSAWLFHPEAGEWMAAERNRPLTSGDRLSTDASGRVDVRIGSTSLRLDANTELEVVRLDDDQIEVYLRSGSLAVRVRTAEAAREFVMSTDDGRFTTQRAGRYRLDRADDASQLTVWSGQASYEAHQSALTVQAGQRAEFWLDRSQRPQYSLGEPRGDAFAAWAGEMDRSADRSASSRYVSPEMTGAEDLDRYGRWEQDPEHGVLWLPREVPAGWAPYAQGHWSWVAPWGWTWVDAAPWGFAPFHYGRWVYVRNNWCWTPGRYVARPVYAPALVGWVGGSGGSVSVSIGGGPAVGWFPLAPGEAWFPRYRVSPRYVRTVNGPNFRNGADIERWILNPSNEMRGAEYRNRKFHHGTTAVPAGAFDQSSRFAPVSPRWRGDQIGRDFDRLPASPVAIVAPPAAWRGARDGARDPRRDGPRDERSDWRRDGTPWRPPVSGGVAGNPPVFGGPGTGGSRERPIERGLDRPAERGVDRPVERSFERPAERPVERSANGDWPSGRSRPALPPGTAIEPGRQPAPPAGVATPAPMMIPSPMAPAARVETMPGDPRADRPGRGDRGFDRPDRPERPNGERMAPAMPAEAPRMAAPAGPPPAVRAAPMPAPAAAPMAPPPMRPAEVARPAPVAPPTVVSPMQSRRPGEGRDPREGQGEPREGRGKPQ